VASLTGDYFPASERGRVYSYILAVRSADRGRLHRQRHGREPDLLARRIHPAVDSGFLPRTGALAHRSEPLRGGQSHLEPA